jgi:hypothetical protein
MLTADPFGTCRGRDDRACGWQYGWNMAERDAHSRALAGVTDVAWWLDVELQNTWEANRRHNRAVLAGMAAYLQTRGRTVGIYSTPAQWTEIAGPVSQGSVLYRLPEWVAGAQTRAAARSTCWSRRFIRGGSVAVAQWYGPAAVIDGDVICPRSPFHTLPLRQ